MSNNSAVTSLAGIFFVLSTGMFAHADTFTFNYTGLTENQTAASTATSVQTYMNHQLGSAGTVTEAGGITDNGYTADGHVVGPSTGPWYNPTVTPYTLGTKDGGTFLVNDSAGISPHPGNSNDINFVFSLTGGAKITSVSFDYEIFPDNSCPSLPCGSVPDIELAADGVQKFIAYGITPGDAGGSTYTASVANPYSWSPETGPQLIGSTTVNNLSASSLDFIDWPATIGIGNVVVTTNGHTQDIGAVPEPASIVLLGTLASFVAFKLRRRSKV